MTHRLALLALAGVLLTGCGNKGIQSEAAVRQGVIDYLSQRSDLNLSTMQIDVTSVSFRQDEADATVSFRPKGSGGDAGMQMRYTLERKGSRWVVKGRGRNQAGQSPHGGAPGQMPPPTPGAAQPMPGEGQGDSGLPPGHPPVRKPSEK